MVSPAANTQLYTDNLTVGAGKLYFRRTSPLPLGAAPDTGYRFLGNCPAFTLTRDTTELDHYTSTVASQQKDRTVITRDNLGGTIQIEDISVDNVAAWLGGEHDTVVEAAGNAQTQKFSGIYPGRYYHIGYSAATPWGADAANVTVSMQDGSQAPAADTYVYTPGSGLLYFFTAAELATLGSASTPIVANASVIVTYTPQGNTREVVIANGTQCVGELMFVSDNTVGQNRKILMPSVMLTSSGDYALIGTTWQSLTLKVSVLTAAGRARFYSVSRLDS